MRWSVAKRQSYRGKRESKIAELAQYVEFFNGKLRDELLNGEILYTLREAKVLFENWRVHYNTIRPHSALGYRPQAPEAIATEPPAAGCAPWPRDSTPPAAGHESRIGVT